MFDFDALTLGEVSTIEELSGLSISAIADEEAPKGKALAAMAMIAKRRSGDPKFTWNQAQALTIQEANELLGFGVEETEEEGKDENSGDNETS